MARDRKRAKQRRDRRARTGAPEARRVEGTTAFPSENPEHEHEAPELASGEVDLADAQLALGRPELVEVPPPAPRDERADAEQIDELEDEVEFERIEDRVDAEEERFEAGIEEGRNGHDEDVAGAELAERVERAPRRAPATERREGNRVTTFLRGSWRELERVQWPDRRQVAQATAVVIGFVIVAGVFLGLMDYLAGKIVDLIV